MRTGERDSCTRFGEFPGFVSRRRKAGSLHGSGEIRSSIALVKPEASNLMDLSAFQLRRHSKGQVDAIRAAPGTRESE